MFLTLWLGWCAAPTIKITGTFLLAEVLKSSLDWRTWFERQSKSLQES